MEAKDLTPLQRIKILEDVLKKLESGDEKGGLCYKITHSAFELFKILDYDYKTIPLFTLENARKVTDVIYFADEVTYWWRTFFYYDFENRIKFVKWMIEQEKLTNNI